MDSILAMLSTQIYTYGFSLENLYVYGLCLHMSFTNPTPIPVLQPNYIGMGTNISVYLYSASQN